MLRVGEGTAEITPPLGIELAGFHKPLGQERVITEIRKTPHVRALALDLDNTQALLLSLDILAVSTEFSRGVRERIAAAHGLPAAHIRVCATHTHSMPTFAFLRQWGKIDPAFQAQVADACVKAAAGAYADLKEADCYHGEQRVQGGNFNRTVPQWKTDADWSPDATDANRWLDTLLQVLYFQREDRAIVWYHFSAHPVCYDDTLAGPDWPAGVAERIRAADGHTPVLLQGHIGDVNPGDGTPWRGDYDETVAAIAPALHNAMNHAELIEVDQLRWATATVDIPLDMARFEEELAHYETHPDQCTDGVWVDAPFAADWFEAMKSWDKSQTSRKTEINALFLGPLALLFHPAELYSYYGLRLRMDAPQQKVMAVGYADDFIGYLTDAKAYDNQEYAAIVVPKIVGLPPFTEAAAQQFTSACAALLKS